MAHARPLIEQGSFDDRIGVVGTGACLGGVLDGRNRSHECLIGEDLGEPRL